jgi:cell division protein FtsB
MARKKRTRKIAVALPSTETAPESWLRNIRFSGFALMVLALIIVAIVVLAPGLRTLIEQQRELAALQKTVVDKQERVDALEGDVARWSDPAYIEAQARERIYFVYPGERSYIVIGRTSDESTDAATLPDGAAISDEIQTTKVDWLGSLVTSVFTAGLTDATPDELTDDGGQ